MNYEVVRVEQIHKSYAHRTILENISFHLNRDDRTALVGENGVGKTTLVRILTGAESADSGRVSFALETEIGVLAQEVTAGLDAEMTIRRYVEASAGALDRLRAELQTLEDRLTQSLDSDEMNAVLGQYGDLQEEYQRRGGYDLDYRIEQIFTGLGIDYLDQSRQVQSLSGGEKTRVALAALLLREPDLLILDEPTNHLDFVALEWLEKYLSAYPKALLLVSHDSTFINRTVNQIFELSPVMPGIEVYHGDYDAYLAEKARRHQTAVDAFSAQKDEMKRLHELAKGKAFSTGVGRRASDNDKFRQNFKNGRIARTISQEIKDAKRRYAELEENRVQHPGRVWRIEFDFEPQPLISTEAIRLLDISKSYGERVLFENLNATVMNGERVIIVAPNGTGKTTLLRIIMGMTAPDAGEVRLAPGAICGYLDQEQETLNLDKSVLESYRESIQVPATDKELISRLHRNGLFSGDGLDEKCIADLSVGQRRKLLLAKLIAAGSNILLLDEPTNHLDFASLEALEEALLDFEGTILAVSHDRRFIDRIGTRVWNIESGVLQEA